MSSEGRWYPLIEHPVQRALVEDPVRFKVVPAGRRSGKTERAKRHIARTAMRYPDEMLFAAAPTHGQAKRIWWADLKQMCFCSILGDTSHSESDLIIRLPNRSQIHVVGLDRPERMEGTPWTGGAIDEIADTHADAWPLNISPALDTINPMRPGYRAWCWLIGVPEGLNHYYDLAEYARTSGDPDWKLYTWKSSDILPPDVIEAAKRRMSARQFRQEYEATFEGTTGRIYEDYSDANTTRETIQPNEQLMWMHDFNFTPLSSAIGTRRGNSLFLMDEIILTSAVAKQTAIEFVDRYKAHANRTLLLYGDPAGRAGEKHGHVSDYTAIESTLREHGWSVVRKVKAAAPAIRDRQNAVRAKVCTASAERSLFVNADKCKYVHKGLSTVQVKAGSTFLEDDRNDTQHITTAVGYCVDYEWPVLVDTSREKKLVVPQQSKNYYGASQHR